MLRTRRRLARLPFAAMLTDTAFSLVFAKRAAAAATEPDLALFAFVVGFFGYVAVLLFLEMVNNDTPTVTMRDSSEPDAAPTTTDSE